MIKQMREDFEEAVATGSILEGYRHECCTYSLFMLDIASRRTAHGYSDETLNSAYKIWKESRLTYNIEVEIPDNCCGFAITVDELKVMLDKVGITLK